MSGYEVKVIDEMEVLYHGVVKLAGAELEVASFGLQVLDFPPDFAGYPEHDHAEDGQEEVYVALRGSGEFAIGDARVPIDPGRMLRVSAGVKRKLEPGPEGIRLLAIGCTPGKLYERPEDFRLVQRA